ncbi:MAG: AAA family ATPase, partial [Fibromonadaceae bacterium]|nr:AAA family ATPase [Fibromonadaceae bacterium]
MRRKRPNIDLSSSEFASFRENNMLYVDKSMFIEHFMDNSSSVLLITRPRRMGKSLNMNMLAEFLDCKKNSGHLFKGLKIEKRKVFKESLNKYPVIYLTFKNLSSTNYKTSLYRQLAKHIEKYLLPEQYTKPVKEIIRNKKSDDEENLHLLIENLHLALGVKPIILIDEYDRLLMNSLHKPDYEKIKNYISEVFEFAFKDSSHIEKVLLTGILRISQESMFSKLNNVTVYDVFEESEFDEDFGLTQKEVKALVEPKDFQTIKK